MTENLASAPITIVSGLPRSGTSLMMQMLAELAWQTDKGAVPAEHALDFP